MPMDGHKHTMMELEAQPKEKQDSENKLWSFGQHQQHRRIKRSQPNHMHSVSELF